MSTLIEIKNLEVTIKQEGHRVVRGIDFSLGEGESLILLGQSGCGKTMTCHSIMGLLDYKKFIVSGQIFYGGRDILSLAARERRKLYGGEIAFVPQNPMTALDPSMRIGKQMLETLLLHRDMSKKEGKNLVLEAIENSGLRDCQRVFHSYPFELSGGMLQRVLIAMVLMVRARLVIADEPTTALDVVNRNETISAFAQLRERGTGVLMVTHDFAAAVQLGGKIVIMNDGVIVEEGMVSEILRLPQHSYTKNLIEASVLSPKRRVV